MRGQNYLTAAPVTSVAGRTGAISLAEADVAGLTADLAGKMQVFTPLAGPVTANHTLGSGEYCPVDCLGRARDGDAPERPGRRHAVRAQAGRPLRGEHLSIACQGVDTFNRLSGSTTLTLGLLNQAVTLQYQASSHIWYVQSSDTPAGSGLDARYLAPIYATSTARTGTTYVAGTVVYDSTLNQIFIGDGATVGGLAAGLRVIPPTNAFRGPNLVGGFAGNYIDPGLYSSSILSGGASGFENRLFHTSGQGTGGAYSCILYGYDLMGYDLYPGARRRT